jgi:hypothetical protein
MFFINPVYVLAVLLAVFSVLVFFVAIGGIVSAAVRKKTNYVIQKREKTVAALDLSAGREIQKKFLPLESDKNGNKLNFGGKETKNASFFGYYQEAEGLSGDYFDYQDIDGRRYAIIKCDVAGKGIPAALIMVQVATIFLNYFRVGDPAHQMEKVVYRINAFIEKLGFRGRFAAFAFCIFDTATGDLHFCNAGDNIIHIFDSSEGRVKKIILPETPAAGALPNDMVESKGGYRVQTLSLDHGDILLLYTDGIEDARRKYRNTGHEHGEMGTGWVHKVINTVMNRGVYTASKRHNSKEHELQFDFSGCQGGVDEVVTALIAVEKMFRCHHNPKAGRNDWAMIDKKVDTFLRAHFVQYRNYCINVYECPENDAYLYYTCLQEDEQYDDLAVLGIKRK